MDVEFAKGHRMRRNRERKMSEQGSVGEDICPAKMRNRF